jgi:hypothetical protein
MSSKLRPNPFSQVTLRYAAGEPVELRVWSATRSRGAVTHNYAKGSCANFAALCRAARLAESGATAGNSPSLQDYVTLTALGLWAPETDLIDPIRLEAPITAGSALPPTPCAPDDFAIRGEIWLQTGGAPPDVVRAVPLGCLSEARPIVWHCGAELAPILPWWPDAACVAAIEAMQQAARRDVDMLPALQALADRGIAVRKSAAHARDAGAFALDIAQGREHFAREGFVDLGQVLPPGQLAAFRHYWHRLAQLDAFPLRSDHRHGSHGEPSSMLLLHALKPLVERLVDAPIKPAYSYAWLYGRGSEMPRHTDRMQCRYTVSLLVDYAPALDGPSPWPLLIWPRHRDAAVEIRQSIGDALLFCGEELRHARPVFTMGERSVSLLLHYVDAVREGRLF